MTATKRVKAAGTFTTKFVGGVVKRLIVLVFLVAVLAASLTTGAMLFLYNMSK